MAARRSSMTTCARCGRCSRRRGRFSGRSIGPGRSASSISGSRGPRSRSGMARRAAAGSWSRAWATRAPAPARWSSPSRRADLLSGSAAVCGRWGAAARRWSGTARPGCTPAAAARPTGSPRSAAQLRVDWHFCEPARSAGQGRRRAPAGLHGAQLRAGPRVRERARLPAPARRLVRRARQPADAQDAALPPDRPALEEREVMAPLPAAAPDIDRRWVLRVAARSRICALTPTTTRSTRGSSAAASRRGSPSARSSRSRWTPASWPAGTSGRSPSTARSPRSSTPARCKAQRHERRARRAGRRGPAAGRYDALIA